MPQPSAVLSTRSDTARPGLTPSNDSRITTVPVSVATAMP
jgi:hypothetical protein